MKRKIHVLTAFLMVFPTVGWSANGKLVVKRNTETKHVERIDFPPGFSVEYVYDDAGKLIKKKLYNFKQVIHCPAEEPCELLPDADGFLRVVIDETIQSKFSSIPSLLNVVERLHKTNQEGFVQDLMGVWQSIELTYLATTIQDQKQLLDQYKKEVHFFQAQVNQKKKINEQVQLIFSDLATKVPAIETYEYLTLPKTFELNPTELQKFSSNINQITACNAKFGGNLKEMLGNGSIQRQKTITDQQFKEIYPLVYHNWMRIYQSSPTEKTVEMDMNWVDKVGAEQSNRAAIILGNILQNQPRLMHTTRTIRQIKQPIISISDRVMLYYPDHLRITMFNDVDTHHKEQFLGDSNVFVNGVFGSDYAHYFEWMLAHEYGHVLQNEEWFHRMEVEKMSSLARLAIKFDDQFKQNFIRKELKEKIQSDLLNPLFDITEQSASYFALDNLPCY